MWRDHTFSAYRTSALCCQTCPASFIVVAICLAGVRLRQLQMVSPVPEIPVLGLRGHLLSVCAPESVIGVRRPLKQSQRLLSAVFSSY